MNSQNHKPSTMIYCYTGDGKGKTTAALGLALRASGYGMKVEIIQFMKGTWHSGEIDAIQKIPHINLTSAGKGFFKILDDQFTEEEHQAAADEALSLIQTVVHRGDLDILILDEANVAADLNLLKTEELIKVLKSIPSEMHVIITGRNAPPEILELADLVTEMKEIKHPFRKGIPAQKGLDF